MNIILIPFQDAWIFVNIVEVSSLFLNCFVTVFISSIQLALLFSKIGSQRRSLVVLLDLSTKTAPLEENLLQLLIWIVFRNSVKILPARFFHHQSQLTLVSFLRNYGCFQISLLLFEKFFVSKELSFRFLWNYRLLLKHTYNFWYFLFHYLSGLKNPYYKFFLCKTHQFCLQHCFFQKISINFIWGNFNNMENEFNKEFVNLNNIDLSHLLIV